MTVIVAAVRERLGSGLRAGTSCYPQVEPRSVRTATRARPLFAPDGSYRRNSSLRSVQTNRSRARHRLVSLLPALRTRPASRPLTLGRSDRARSREPRPQPSYHRMRCWVAIALRSIFDYAVTSAPRTSERSPGRGPAYLRVIAPIFTLRAVWVHIPDESDELISAGGIHGRPIRHPPLTIRPAVPSECESFRARISPTETPPKARSPVVVSRRSRGSADQTRCGDASPDPIYYATVCRPRAPVMLRINPLSVALLAVKTAYRRDRRQLLQRLYRLSIVIRWRAHRTARRPPTHAMLAASPHSGPRARDRVATTTRSARSVEVEYAVATESNPRICLNP